jgi:YggT family protein
MVFEFAIQFVNMLVTALTTVIFLYAIFSFFVPRGGDNPIMRFLGSIAEPILGPLRRVLPSMGMLDLSPMVAIILLQVVGSIVTQTLLAAARG